MSTKNSWAVIEERDEGNTFVAYHIMPMVTLDGDEMPSAAHDLSETCPCHPLFGRNVHGCVVWNHHDPDHDGALTDSEWEEKKQEAH